MKGLLLRLAAVACGVALAVLAIEASLRLVAVLAGAPPAREVAVYEEYEGGANSGADRESPRPAPGAARFRILVIGDSFTWGTGVYVEDTYPRRLEAQLERLNADLDVEVRVLSRPGWNTEVEYEAARRFNPHPRPDLVILGYCLNDAESRHREGMVKLVKPLDRREPQSSVARFVIGRSRFAALVWNRLENSRQRRAFDRYYRRIYRPDFFSNTELALDHFRSLAWDWRAPLVVVVFPVFDQPLDRGYGYAFLHQRIDAALQARDIATLDLLDAYRGIDARRLAVEPFADSHPNELAHRIASQRLAEFLVAQGLVPAARDPEPPDELSSRAEKGMSTER